LNGGMDVGASTFCWQAAAPISKAAEINFLSRMFVSLYFSLMKLTRMFHKFAR
jgi:hypothetical protein